MFPGLSFQRVTRKTPDPVRERPARSNLKVEVDIDSKFQLRFQILACSTFSFKGQKDEVTWR